MTTEKKFWQWFIAHQDELFNFETDRERIFDELSGQLNRVQPDLTFEFGYVDGQREFVVSAGGLRSAFPAVSSLVCAAPKLDRWRITAFRPRRSELLRVELGGKSIGPEEIEFTLLVKGSKIGLQIFIPEFNESDITFKQIAYLMLDDALGEYDVETKIGFIQMLPSASRSTGTRYPLTALPSLFDRLALKLAEQTLPN